MAFYEVVLNGKIKGNDMLTVLHYDVTGTMDGTLLAGVFAGNISPTYIARMVPNVQFDGITIREDIPGGVGVFYPFAAAPIIGTDPDADFWSQTALTVRKLTSSGSRPTQGRVYQGGLAGGAVGNNGFIQQNVIDDVVAFWEAMRIWTLTNGAAGQLVIKANNPSAPNTVAYNLVTSIGARAIPSTQRRRKLNVGS